MYFLLSGCENPDILRIILFAKKILDIVFLIVPIGLIVMLTIDLVKMTISNDSNQKKSMKLITNRIIFAIVMFLTPTIVSVTMNLISSAGINVGNGYKKCIANAEKNTIRDFQIIQDEEDRLAEEKRKQELQDKLNNSNNGNNGSSVGGGFGGSSNSGNNNSGSNNSGNIGGTNGNEESGNIYQNLANEMIRIASAEVGTKEGPNDDNKYGKELGINNQPWCAIFVTWVGKHTTVGGTNLLNGVIQKEKKINNPYSAVNSIYTFSTSSNLNFYYSNKYGGNYTPKKGDYIYFNWNGNWNKKIYPEMFSEGQHVGIVEYVKDGMVYTIEGNASGGSVAKLSYNLNSNSIMGYGSWYK